MTVFYGCFPLEESSGISYLKTCLIYIHPPMSTANLTTVPLTLPVALALTQPVVAWQWVT